MFSLPLQAQEVIASSGNYYQNENGTISWTLGETAIETYSSADMILTQGFQQPAIIISTYTEELDADFQISAYPNPTKAHVILSTGKKHTDNLTYRVYDMQGQLVISNPIEGLQTLIAFDGLQSGTYFIRITHEEKSVKVFKIIKQ